MASLNVIAALVISFIILGSSLVQPKRPQESKGQLPLISTDGLKVESCTPQDFQLNRSCTLSCLLEATVLGLKDPQLTGYTFNYYSTLQSLSVDITRFSEQTTLVSDSGHVSFRLELPIASADYRSGHYTCHLRVKHEKQTTSYSHDFQIDSATAGVPINGLCSNQNECLALEAACIGFCCCRIFYPIPYIKSINTPACLPPSHLGEKCIISDQCQYFVNEYGNCIDGVCQDKTLSKGAIAGIVLACISFLVVMVSIVIFVKWRFG